MSSTYVNNVLTAASHRFRMKVLDVSFLDQRGAETPGEWLDYRGDHRFYRDTDFLFLN